MEDRLHDLPPPAEFRAVQNPTAGPSLTPPPQPGASADSASGYEQQQAENVLQTPTQLPPCANEEESTPFLSKDLDLRSNPPAMPAQHTPITPPYQRYRYTDMSKWMTEDVCEWLKSVAEIEDEVIDEFRARKIKGKALKKMTEENMRKYISGIEIGDILEIIDERDNFQPETAPRLEVGNPACMPPASGPTVHLFDLESASSQHPTKQPVQCTSLKRSDGNSHDESAIPLHQTLMVIPGENEADSTETPLKHASQATEEEANQDDSMETPFKHLAVTEADSTEAPPEYLKDDPCETPLKQPKTEETGATDEHETSRMKLVDPYETSRMKLVDPYETPLKRIADNTVRELGESNHSPDTYEVENSPDAACETPLKAVRRSEQPETVSTTDYVEDVTGACDKTYTEGNTVRYSEGQQVGSFKNIHKFVNPGSVTTKRERVEFVRETVAFICACLNEGSQGTIHFGITSHSEGSQVAGIIKGVKTITDSWGEFEEDFKKALEKCFDPDKMDTVCRSIRSLQCIPVLPAGHNEPQENLCVIEVTISPTSDLKPEEAFVTMLPSYQNRKATYSPDALFFKFIDGQVRECDEEEKRMHMENKLRIANEQRQREEQEEASKLRDNQIHEDLRLKLSELLCKGEDSMPVDTYPILVVNKPPDGMTDEEMRKKLSFLANVPFKATFDFDEKPTLSTYINRTEKIPIKVRSTADDFKASSEDNENTPGRLESLHEDIKNSPVQYWIFGNGHITGRKSPYQWKMQSKDGFREAVKFYLQEIPKGRALIVFLLLSDDLDVMIEASEELVVSFQQQWMVISEDESLANTFAEKLIARNCLDEKTWKENSIINVPLYQVSESIKQLQGPVNQRKQNDPILVTRRGATIPLRENLPGLDVLSYSQCDNFHIKPPTKFQKRKEEEYYKGGQVDWWNFWYKHVLDRSKLQDLTKLIESALRGQQEGDPRIGHIALYHQAGAGGTTLAMNALWDQRKRYRCAVVNSLSDPIQTAHQILKLREYEEEDIPNPVLILVDNLEDEKVNLMMTEIEEMTKQISRYDSTRHQTVVCVFIHCLRRNELPSEMKNRRILLKHQLDSREKAWFEDKYQIMEKKHAANLAGDPELLISFNIMKEEFNMKFMERTVTRLLADVTDPLEKKLIKFIAVLNAFDIQSRALPIAAFDAMMNNMLLWTPRNPRNNRRWEINLSSPSKVLLIVSKQVSMGGYINAISIVSPLLSRYIVDRLRMSEPKRQTICDVTMELFDTASIFGSQSRARGRLIEIVEEVLKAREKGPVGLPEKKFSPIIQEVLQESPKKAIELMQVGFQLTNDPFVAQQLARLYIHASMWKEAKEMAKVATDMKSENSYLWDTYGRAYLGELTADLRSFVTLNKPLKPAECASLVECAFTGIDIFKRVQRISMEANYYVTNNSAGYFGELQTIRSLLDSLLYVQAFSTKDHLKLFLVDPDYDIPEMTELDNMVKDARAKLKELAESSRNAISSLENEHIQLRGENLNESERRSQHGFRRKLTELKSHLYPYFGEEEDEPPEHYSEEQKCSYRRRRLFQLGAYNMLQIFDLKDKEEGEEQLNQIAKIVSNNINTDFETADDLQVIMCVNITLVQISEKYAREISFEDMVNMSQRLYERRDTRRFIHLEPYLFYIMFNWPQQSSCKSTSSTAQACTINHTMFTSAIESWKDAYFAKYPRQREAFRKKDVTLFFFAKGTGMKSLASQSTLKMKGILFKGEAFWNQPIVQRELRRFEGQLCEDGNKVKVSIKYPSGHTDTLKIPTSFPITDREMWFKTVYFVIGFSWKGPKAFHVSLENPAQMASNYRADFRQDEVRKRNPPLHHVEIPGMEPHVVFMQKVSHITKQLAEIEELKAKEQQKVSLSPVEKSMLGTEEYLRKEHDSLIRSRTKAIGKSFLASLFEQ